MKKWVVCLLFTWAGVAWSEAPKGWDLMGSEPKSYESGVDHSIRHGKKPSGYLKSTRVEIQGFGALGQRFLASRYQGRRIRLSAWIKTRDVKDWAGLWMRIDGEDGKVLAFDNMQSRAVQGTHDWKQCSVVLDVPRNAKYVNLGVVLSKEGQVWVSEAALDVVEAGVPVTGDNALEAPTNLDFSH